eukprot:scaffold2765_cov271-Chaetoceros_neogracile.AAC.8
METYYLINVSSAPVPDAVDVTWGWHLKKGFKRKHGQLCTHTHACSFPRMQVKETGRQIIKLSDNCSERNYDIETKITLIILYLGLPHLELGHRILT